MENPRADLTCRFQKVAALPLPLKRGQCVFHNHELLICGGYYERACFSYHILQNQYKLICRYPAETKFYGHTVVKLEDSSDEDSITLLSLGGYPKHTMIMKYTSVWSGNKVSATDSKCVNQWVPLTDRNNRPVCIGREKDNYEGMRAVIGGSKNHLLFITYPPKNIDVFNLNTLRYVVHSTFPSADDWVWYHCFMFVGLNGLAMMPKQSKRNGKKKNNNNNNNNNNNKNTEMVLFFKKTGLSINFDEASRCFTFHKLPIYANLASFKGYACVNSGDQILFFGGCNGPDGKNTVSNTVYKYSLGRNEWTKFEHTLPYSLCECTAILDANDIYVHILGGKNGNGDILKTHLKTGLEQWVTDTKSEEAKIWSQQNAHEHGIYDNESKDNNNNNIMMMIMMMMMMMMMKKG
ncbi:Kelch repeat-containing protein [Reticulomyxa filosa]|uniref:Kelch repeat-containing protein n=1 Tax=Reticulomyxa filosa TaxID=46433 RepID=X6P5L9_RETFI|nr:Kelch repeat-containing protein [Reticulomyxa filosa]|eukprot:ETO33501.1 Kelch repeat-containing protein [Reticulomyxa filosa]